MDATPLANKIRKMIDEETLAANMSERDACQFGSEVCGQAAEGYDMRLGEIMDEEDVGWDEGDI